jgi:hypothetical protein
MEPRTTVAGSLTTSHNGVRDSDPSEPEYETDVCYAGYAGRDMSIGFGLCVVWTCLAFAAIPPWFRRFGEGPEAPGFLIAYGLSLAAWIAQVARWVSRKCMYQIRLTTGRLVFHRGPFFGWHIVPLIDIGRVSIRQHAVQRMLGIGRVVVISDAESPAETVLCAVTQPKELADTIRRQVTLALGRRPALSRPE